MILNVKTTCRWLLLLALGISSPSWAAKPANVLVIINENSAASREIGAYYAAKRRIPARNVLRIKCPAEEIIKTYLYKSLVEKPVKEYLEKKGLKDSVDYLVLTKGVPIKLSNYMSLDSVLMSMDLGLEGEPAKIGVPNPYFGEKGSFSHKKYGFYLATRLDGYTVKDAKALVDRSLAAKPEREAFLIDLTPSRDSRGYKLMNDDMKQAHELITRKGYLSFLDDTKAFVGGRKHLMGYFSWGSNDPSYTVEAYKSNKFVPGAIAETAVSSSARTFERTKDGGQSLIADLIEAGVTGVKGYVSEPTLTAIARPQILFDRYLSGFNLAESFYMASPFIYWKGIVIGDPLCAPYAGRK